MYVYFMYRRIPQSFNKAFALLIHMSNLEEYSLAFMFSRVGNLKLFFTKKACSWGGGGGGGGGGGEIWREGIST